MVNQIDKGKAIVINVKMHENQRKRFYSITKYLYDIYFNFFQRVLPVDEPTNVSIPQPGSCKVIKL
jgi:hypothetical protein